MTVQDIRDAIQFSTRPGPEGCETIIATIKLDETIHVDLDNALHLRARVHVIHDQLRDRILNKLFADRRREAFKVLEMLKGIPGIRLDQYQQIQSILMELTRYTPDTKP